MPSGCMQWVARQLSHGSVVVSVFTGKTEDFSCCKDALLVLFVV